MLKKHITYNLYFLYDSSYKLFILTQKSQYDEDTLYRLYLEDNVESEQCTRRNNREHHCVFLRHGLRLLTGFNLETIFVYQHILTIQNHLSYFNQSINLSQNGWFSLPWWYSSCHVFLTIRNIRNKIWKPPYLRTQTNNQEYQE